MEKLLYFSLGLNLVLLTILCCKKTKKKIQTPQKKSCQSTLVPQVRPCVNKQLRIIAEACEARLAEQDRGKVKLLVERENTDKVAALQIGNLRISLCRDKQNQSLFKVDSFIEALKLANSGYNGTARYITVPAELESILAQRHIINVYLDALGLEQISEKEDFWCIDTKTDRSTEWKRFNGSVNEAFLNLHRSSKIRNADGQFLSQVVHEEKTNLILLLKGWEHLFIEV